MRLLHVISSVDPRHGGPIEGVFSSAEVWSQHGHTRHIVSLDDPDAPWVASARAPVIALGPSSGFARALHRWIPWMRYGYSPHLVRYLKAKAGEYDAVVVNGLWNYNSFGAWRGLHGGGTPYYVYTHGMLDPWFNRAYPLKTFFKSLFWRLIEHRVLRDAAGVLFTCEEERRLASRSFAPYRANEIVVGYGTRDVGGDPERQREAFFAAAPQLRGRRFVLFLSRIHEKKGVDLLIDAFARVAAAHPELDLVVAGPDQSGLRKALEARAAQLGIRERVHWPGMLSGDVKFGAYRAAEFFALPSHQENFGIVVAESLAIGTPVAITDKVNIWREIEAHKAGVVVSDDLEGVETALKRMLALSHEERAQMGAAARRCFQTCFDLEQNALDLLAIVAQNRQEDAHAPGAALGGAAIARRALG